MRIMPQEHVCNTLLWKWVLKIFFFFDPAEKMFLKGWRLIQASVHPSILPTSFPSKAPEKVDGKLRPLPLPQPVRSLRTTLTSHHLCKNLREVHGCTTDRQKDIENANIQSKINCQRTYGKFRTILNNLLFSF